jgi:hypothetical protein
MGFKLSKLRRVCMEVIGERNLEPRVLGTLIRGRRGLECEAGTFRHRGSNVDQRLKGDGMKWGCNIIMGGIFEGE